MPDRSITRRRADDGGAVHRLLTRVGLARSGDGSDLAQEAERVEADPLLLQLATIEAGKPDTRKRNHFACWGDTHELAPVGAAHRPPDDDSVCVGDQILF